jgi:CDP-diacylglycerol--serine O-phosphatidyltransferase
VGVADKRYFRGLPSPAAAAVVVGLVWVLHANGVPGKEISIAALIVTVMAGVLMVSNVRFRSFKDVDLRGRVSFMTILAMPLVLVLLFQDPPLVLFLTFLVYALSGPLGYVFRRTHHEAKDPEKHPHGRV